MVCMLTHTPVRGKLAKKGHLPLLLLWESRSKEIMLRYGAKHILILSNFFPIHVGVIMKLTVCVCLTVSAVILCLEPT